MKQNVNIQTEYVPNHVYKFEVTPLVDIPRIIVPVDRVDWNTDAFGNDEDKVQEAYFTKERINELKRKYIKMIEETENPFHIYCVDTDGDYAFTDDEIFSP